MLGVLPVPEKAAVAFLPTHLVLFTISSPDKPWEFHSNSDAVRDHEATRLGIFLVIYKARRKALLFQHVLMSTARKYS